MNKIIKYSIGFLAVILVIYLSLDIQSLDKHRATFLPSAFNATDYAAKFWNESIPLCIASAPQISNILKTLNDNPENAFAKYGHKLGVSKTHYFMLKGKGIIKKIEDEFLVLLLDDNTKVNIATEFIYGNAVRDASGKVNINDFLNMTDFNIVSLAINKLVKEKAVSRLKKYAEVGKEIEFAGAMEINEENIDLSAVRIIPVSIKVSDGKSE